MTMWHPLRKRALERKTRAQDEFAQRIEQTLSDALKLPDLGARLDVLARIQTSIDAHLQDEITVQNRTASGRTTNWIVGGGLGTAAACSIVLPLLHIPPVGLAIVGYFALFGAGTVTGGVLGSRAENAFKERSNAENAPFHARLEDLRDKAGAAIDQILAGDLREVAKSPVFMQIIDSVPQVRAAFAAAAVQAAAPDQPAPPVPPPAPGQGLRL